VRIIFHFFNILQLKEFQRIKKDQIDKNAKEHTDPEKQNNDQVTFAYHFI
jgi:hypothetical protein